MLSLLFIVACESLENPFLDSLPSASQENRSPDTHLFLEFAPDHIDTVLSDTSADTTFILTQYLPDTTTSHQVLYWWGEDPDGEVVAYYHRWSFQDEWTRTEAESDTFFLPLQRPYEEYVFEIKAEDNNGAQDLTPATLRIPIANTAPEIEFQINSNPAAGSDPNVEFVTFPTRTFTWTVTDLDGYETINRLRYAVDDTSQWTYLSSDINSVTLRELGAGRHTFFVQAIDTAGATSNLLTFPDTLDDAVPNYWSVREPVGTVLLVDDDPGIELQDSHTIYVNMLESIYGADGYTLYDLSQDPYGLPPSYQDQLAMYSYFEKVIWFHYGAQPTLPDADAALRSYVDNGKNLFVSSMNVLIESQPADTTWYSDYSFVEMDSIFILNPTGRMTRGLKIYQLDPSQSGSGVIQDSLVTGSSLIRRVCSYKPLELEPGATSTDLFVLQNSRNANDAWTGNPSIAQLYQPSPASGKTIFFSIPFQYCDGAGNLEDMFRYLLEDVLE